MYAVPTLFMHDLESLSDLISRDTWENLVDPAYISYVAPIVVSVLGLQAAMISSVPRPGAHSPGTPPGIARVIGAAMVVGVFAAAITMIAMLVFEPRWFPQEWSREFPGLICLVVGVVATLISAVVLRARWRRGVGVGTSYASAIFLGGAWIAATVYAIVTLGEWIVGDRMPDAIWVGVVFGIPFVGWLVATPLVLAFARRHTTESAISSLANWLFIGTVFEAAAVIPLDVMVRRKSDCYCSEGSFWSLVVLAGVGFATFGPAVYLLPIGRRRKRLVEGCCPVCGYDMSGVRTADRCSECGAGWKRGMTN